MRFLADENFPGAAVEALCAAGHDVIWIRTAAPGAKDEAVLSWAVREARVLLTFDKDFGELAWRWGLPASCGVILFRVNIGDPKTIGAVLAGRLAERGDWAGHFSVIEDGRVRMRALRQDETED
jgi:predicted nuclease of predicted toxin-antitoxin system